MFGLRKEQVTEQRMVYTGEVRFIHKDQILEGRIFGEFYRNGNMLFPEYHYNILVDKKVYKDIPHHMIENK